MPSSTLSRSESMRLGRRVVNAALRPHVSRVLAKLGLASRSQAVVFAYETGL